MRENFIEKFIKEELYLQNPPLKTDKFIEFCKNRGINTNEKELERFEKENLFYPIIRTKNYENSAFENSYIVPSFSDYEKKWLNSLFKENRIFDPSKTKFQPYSSFKEEGYSNEKISSYYSNFQIDSLKKIKDIYNFDSENGIIFSDKKEFDKLIEFFILIQIYSPFGRSNSRTITIYNNDEKWAEKIDNFYLGEVLDYLNLDIEYVSRTYWNLSIKIESILGDSDWIQLYKYINWNKKDKLKGKIRLGIEYLQWALMLKRCIEDYHGKNIFDIDEYQSYSPENLLTTATEDAPPRTLRGIRNKNFFNQQTGECEYFNNYKRLFFLANEFNLNYHPRLIVFVEGKTEKETLPKFFEFVLKKPENLGIDFVDISGISKFYGQKLNIPMENKKYKKIVLSNFKNLINYSLEKWQVLPFFIGDNENKILDRLKKGNLFDFVLEKDCTLPNDWYHVWEKDFELDNYSDEELLVAIEEVLGSKINLKQIQKARKDKNGINSIDEKISDNKVKISNQLFENLKNNYSTTKDKKILDKPVFEVIKKILDITVTNHPPVHTLIENKNKDIKFDIIIKKKI